MTDTNKTPKTDSHAPLSGVVLSCPFCGSNEVFISEEKSNDKTVTWYTIHHGPTTTCSISFITSNRQDLIDMWNKRV